MLIYIYIYTHGTSVYSLIQRAFVESAQKSLGLARSSHPSMWQSRSVVLKMAFESESSCSAPPSLLSCLLVWLNSNNRLSMVSHCVRAQSAYKDMDRLISSHTLTPAHAHTYTFTHSLSLSHTHTHTHTCTHAPSLSLSHTHTHTHFTPTLSLPHPFCRNDGLWRSFKSLRQHDLLIFKALKIIIIGNL